MKCRNPMLFFCLIVLGIVMGLFSTAWARHTFSLSTTSDGITPKDWFAPGDAVYVDIGINDAGGVAGCAFTLEYPEDILIAPFIDHEGVSDGITSDSFPFRFNSHETHRAGETDTGRLRLAGAAIHVETGGPLYSAGPVRLFRLRFTVAETAPEGGIDLKLLPTELWSPSAGYGVDTAGDGVYDPAVDEMGLVDVLVGAVDNTHEDWSVMARAFPALLPDVPDTLAETSVVVIDPSTYTPVSVELTEHYDPYDPKTWPLVASGDNVSFRAAGGTGTDYEWSVEGPSPVDGMTGEAFEFEAPIQGAFAGTYTVTVRDSQTSDQTAFYVKVPMAIIPETPKTIPEDRTQREFYVEGAPEGTGLAVSLVTPDERDIDNAQDVIGEIVINEAFNADASAGFTFTPAESIGMLKAFRFRAQAIEAGGQTPLADDGLDIAFSDVIHFTPAVDESTDAAFEWDRVRISIKAGDLSGPALIEVDTTLPVEPTSRYMDKSTMLVIIKIHDANIENPITITLPFDTARVNPGDFEAKRALIHHAADEAALIAGENVREIDPLDISDIDYDEGYVSFQVSELSVFAVGSPEDASPPSGGGSSGGCFIGAIRTDAPESNAK